MAEPCQQEGTAVCSSRHDDADEHGNPVKAAVLLEVRDCKKANGIYELHKELYNGKPVWKRSTGGGSCYIFCSPQKQAWFINDRLAKESTHASIHSLADLPPVGCWDRSGQAQVAVFVSAQPDEENEAAGHGAATGEVSTDSIEVRDCKRADGIYEQLPDTHDGKRVWKRATGGSCYIFFSAKHQAWYINDKLLDKGYASAMSTAERPPLGRWDRNGIAILMPHTARNVVAKAQFEIWLDSSALALQQLQNGFEGVCQAFSPESDVKTLEEKTNVYSIVTDANGNGFTQSGIPDLGGKLADLEFPLRIQFSFDSARSSRKKSADLPVFVPAGLGRIAARGAPSSASFGRWASEAGASYVVTLLKEGEPAYAMVCQRGLDLVEEGSLKGWLHLPLSGGGCVNDVFEDTSNGRLSTRCKDAAAQDKESLARVQEIVELLQNGESVVVHCAAGLHRTGIVCYMALRLLGHSAEDSLQAILASRPLTHTEVMKRTRKHAPLCELAEELLSKWKSV